VRTTPARPGRCCPSQQPTGQSAPRGIRTPNRQIHRLVLYGGLVGSSRICPAHVGCVVDRDRSRRVPSDRLDDQTDDQARQARSMGRGRVRPQDLSLVPGPQDAAGAMVCGSCGWKASERKTGAQIRPLDEATFRVAQSAVRLTALQEPVHSPVPSAATGSRRRTLRPRGQGPSMRCGRG
jgi:hypothetical protein